MTIDGVTMRVQVPYQYCWWASVSLMVSAAGSGEDAALAIGVAVIEVTERQLVVVAEVVIHLAYKVVAGIGVDVVIAEVVGAGDVVSRAVGLGVERHDLDADRVEPAGGNAIAGERRTGGGAGGVPGIVDGVNGPPRCIGRGEVAGPFEQAGHVERAHRAVAAPRALIRREEERLVMADRPAQAAPKDVVAQRRLLLDAIRHRREEIRSVEGLVAQILENAAAEPVRTALGGGHHHAPGRAAEFGREAVGDHLDFLERIDRQVNVHLPGADPHVLRACAVDVELRALHASAGQAEVRFGAGVVSAPHGSPRDLDQVHGAAVAERHVLNALRFDQLA